MNRPVQFYFRGAIRAVQPASIQRTVLQWLREDQRACGTKEGCNEGDCGACMVVVGEQDGAGGLRLQAVNACIQLLPALDRKVLLTVEDLQTETADGSLHPVQQAMVEQHGSQCGFCTPGFVMSLYAAYQQHVQAPDRATLDDILSGNLCRCTGYRPILDALPAACALPRCAPDRAPLLQALDQLQALPPLQLSDGHHTWHAPTTLASLAELRLHHPDARLLAGSTDVGLWVTKQMRDLGDVIHVLQVAELRRIEQHADVIRIGAAVTLEPAWAALVAEYPELAELKRRFASLPIRNAGTLVGNVANGSPIGDSMPALVALGAQVLLRRGDHTRRMALEDFYLAYQRTALQVGEFVQAVEVPRRPAEFALRAYKVSKRFDQDISAVCIGVGFAVTEGRIHAVRIGCGGVAATIRRAPRAEAALEGQPLSPPAFAAAAAVIVDEFEPLSDVRATAGYRREMLSQLMVRAGLELDPARPPDASRPVRLLDLQPVVVD